MTSQNNKKDNMLQNIQYCVLIDGDFGRHELFSDIHPFTLNRFEHEEQIMEFMSKTSDIHYHIYYNSAFPEIVEYYQVLKMFYHTNIFLHPSLTKETNRYSDFTEILTKYKYNHFWIIHGTENNCEELIQFLQSNINIQAEISHYSWLENLRNASNRIEYLFKHKINDQLTDAEVKCTFNTSEKESVTLNAYRLEENPIDTELTQNQKTTIIEKPKDTTTVAKKMKIPCGFDGCKKEFATTDALKAHQTAKKHLNETTNTTTWTFNLDDCRDEFATIADLKSDETTNEYISDETDSTTSTNTIEKSNVTADSKVTARRFNLNDYQEVFAIIEKCKSDPRVSKYLNDETDSSTSASIVEDDEESNITADSKIPTMVFNLKAYRDDDLKSTKKQHMQCNFDNCNRSYTKLNKLNKHQVNTHPIPLRCLYTVECCNSNEAYLGKNDLEIHVKSQHASLFPSLRCPVVSCSHSKLFRTWISKLNHDIKIHHFYLLASEFSPPTVANMSTWDTSGPFACSNKDCEQFYWEEEASKRHEAFEHHVAVQCPYGLECQQNGKKHVNRWILQRHITKVHASQFPQPTCFDPSCQSQVQNWNKIVYHLLQRHLDALGLIETTSIISSTSTKHEAKKCSYDNCNEIFRDRKSFLTHLILVHPHPLRCPYKSNCNKTPILGLTELKQHIETNHSAQFTKPKCFHKKCQEEKDFSDWKTVLDHIVQMHFPDIKSN